MEFDIIIPCYYNYVLVKLQIEQYLKIKGNWRLLICDNTPKQHRINFSIDHDRVKVFQYDDIDGIDGERHGSVIDYMVKQTTTEYIGIQDSDFFWTDPDILLKIEKYIKQGYECIGTDFYYGERNEITEGNVKFWEAPCIFGMFVKRELALKDTFISTKDEAQRKKETGWRMRQRIVDEKIKNKIFNAYQLPEQRYDNIKIQKAFFYADMPVFDVLGFHIFHGSGDNIHISETLHNRLFEIYYKFKN